MSQPMPRVHHGDNPWDSDVKNAEQDAMNGDAAILKDLLRLQLQLTESDKRLARMEKWMWLHQGIFGVVGVIGYMVFQKLFK